MTNERAREVLQEQIDRYGQEYDAEGIEALEIAIKALEESRNMTNEELYQGYIRLANENERLHYEIQALQEEPQRAKGHLVSNQQDGEVKPFWERYRCSVCGEYAQDNFNYCSRCGAELEGEEE